jgi:hypothetical protein
MLRICTLLALFTLALQPLFAAEPFVVHEWGVYVRNQSVITYNQGGRGRTAKTGAVDILSSPQESICDLPAFVKRHAGTYVVRQEHRAWDKPVIHFYGPENLEVQLQVAMPRGTPLAYWPMPEFNEEIVWWMGSGESTVTGLKWKGKLKAAPNSKVAEIPEGHWWKALRKVPGMWIQCEGGTERFIFYEGLAVQGGALNASIKGDELQVVNSGAEASGRVLVLVNDGAARHFITLDNIAAGGKTQISRADVLKGAGDETALLTASREQWESYGMTAEEATAIVEAWKPDLLGHIGVMVIGKIPASTYDKMFPLTVTPQPEKIVRVGVVFDHLPGDAGRLAWLPALENTMKTWAADLGKEDFEVRNTAKKRFGRLGDLAKGFLETLKKNDDPEVKSTISELTGAIEKTPELRISHYKPENETAKPSLVEYEKKK